MSVNDSEKPDEPTEKLPSHHKKLDYCFTRKPYRKGRRSTAVKVFTVNTESQYLMVKNVHATGLHKDVVKLFSKYGNVIQCDTLKEYPSEPFKEVFLVKFQEIQSARIAKRRTDEVYFYGSMLHVFYAPEYETPEETRAKLMQRRAAVVDRIRSLRKESNRFSFKDAGAKKSPRSRSDDAVNPMIGEPSLQKRKEGTFANLQSSIVIPSTIVQGGKLSESFRSCSSTAITGDTDSVASAMRTKKEQIKKTLKEKMKPMFIRTSSYIPPDKALPTAVNSEQNSDTTSFDHVQYNNSGIPHRDSSFQIEESIRTGSNIAKSSTQKLEASKRTRTSNFDESTGLQHKAIKLS